MQTLWKIVARYSNFLVFLALEVAAFMLISRNNAYPRSSMLSTANSFVAWQNEQLSAVHAYFSLRTQNELLAQENAELRNRICAMESAENRVPWQYADARVVQMTTDQIHNYLTINRGSEDGVLRGQGVRNGEGVVGMVSTVGRHYSVVLPLINTHSHTSCRFLKNDYVATLQWDGRDSRFAQLADVAAHMVVNAGDTVVTSGLSPVFPEGIPVGVVDKSELKPGDSYHTIQVRLFTNFKRIKFVELIHNNDHTELESLYHGLD